MRPLLPYTIWDKRQDRQDVSAARRGDCPWNQRRGQSMRGTTPSRNRTLSQVHSQLLPDRWCFDGVNTPRRNDGARKPWNGGHSVKSAIKEYGHKHRTGGCRWEVCLVAVALDCGIRCKTRYTRKKEHSSIEKISQNGARHDDEMVVRVEDWLESLASKWTRTTCCLCIYSILHTSSCFEPQTDGYEPLNDNPNWP